MFSYPEPPVRNQQHRCAYVQAMIQLHTYFQRHPTQHRNGIHELLPSEPPSKLCGAFTMECQRHWQGGQECIVHRLHSVPAGTSDKMQAVGGEGPTKKQKTQQSLRFKTLSPAAKATCDPSLYKYWKPLHLWILNDTYLEAARKSLTPCYVAALHDIAAYIENAHSTYDSFRCNGLEPHSKQLRDYTREGPYPACPKLDVSIVITFVDGLMTELAGYNSVLAVDMVSKPINLHLMNTTLHHPHSPRTTSHHLALTSHHLGPTRTISYQLAATNTSHRPRTDSHRPRTTSHHLAMPSHRLVPTRTHLAPPPTTSH